MSPLTLSLPIVPLIDFTLSNARRFYLSMGNPTGLKGLTAARLCGSRKYPYPHHGRSLEIPRERGGLKGINFQGVGGFRGKLLFQRVTNHIQNIESNIRSIWSTKRHYRTMFWNKSQFWDKVNTISFNVSVFFLWVSKRYNLYPASRVSFNLPR